MFTDAQLTKKSKSETRYIVTIVEKNDRVPRLTLATDSKTAKEAREFGNEYALRILGLGNRSYFLLIQKAGK
jgi:hypothetical protein